MLVAFCLLTQGCVQISRLKRYREGVQYLVFPEINSKITTATPEVILWYRWGSQLLRYHTSVDAWLYALKLHDENPKRGRTKANMEDGKELITRYCLELDRYDSKESLSRIITSHVQRKRTEIAYARLSPGTEDISPDWNTLLETIAKSWQATKDDTQSDSKSGRPRQFWLLELWVTRWCSHDHGMIIDIPA